MGRSHPPEGNPKARGELTVGDQEGLTLQRETLRLEKKLKLETGKVRRAQRWIVGTGRPPWWEEMGRQRERHENFHELGKG
jgi:hypothetical protein